MISAPTGVSQKVIGRIIAMVVSGPMPGRTPIAVPITQPKKHKPIFCQVSATPNPMTMLDNRSSTSESRRPQRDHDAEREYESSDNGSDQNDAEQQERKQAHVADGEARQHGADRQRQDKA